MKKTYTAFVCEQLGDVSAGIPIYTGQIAKKISTVYSLSEKAAAAAAAVAIKRIIDNRLLPDLRCYQKGIYYRTVATPFGETGINKEQLIADKYLLPDIGYETGLTVLHQMGLTSQMPRERVLATNIAKDCMREDKKLGVVIRPPKVPVTAGNKDYLQILDALDIVEKAPVNEEYPYQIIAEHIQKKSLQYKILLAFADQYYNRNTVLCLAHTANMGGSVI
ncbi:MAG: hypothetical protein NC086_01420 [Alistipes sp.]|nr:hypothetical protein [Alistipes sp.]